MMASFTCGKAHAGTVGVCPICERDALRAQVKELGDALRLALRGGVGPIAEERDRLRAALDVALRPTRALCPACSGDAAAERDRIRAIADGAQGGEK